MIYNYTLNSVQLPYSGLGAIPRLILYSAIPRFIILYSTIPRFIILYSAIPRFIILYSTIPRFILHSAIPFPRFILYSAIPFPRFIPTQRLVLIGQWYPQSELMNIHHELTNIRFISLKHSCVQTLVY